MFTWQLSLATTTGTAMYSKDLSTWWTEHVHCWLSLQSPSWLYISPPTPSPHHASYDTLADRYTWLQSPKHHLVRTAIPLVGEEAVVLVTMSIGSTAGQQTNFQTKTWVDLRGHWHMILCPSFFLFFIPCLADSNILHCGKNLRIFQDAADQTLPVTDFFHHSIKGNLPEVWLPCLVYIFSLCF
jgi:hypothetical protein